LQVATNVGFFGALDEHVVHLFVGVDLTLVLAQLKLFAVDGLYRATGGSQGPFEHFFGAAGALIFVVDTTDHQLYLALQVLGRRFGFGVGLQVFGVFFAVALGYFGQLAYCVG